MQKSPSRREQIPISREVIRINLSLNRGFRRGEGGWVDRWGAFMVARG